MSKEKNISTDLAGRMYETSDYKREDELSNGLAMTHEQASDSYMEGEIGSKSERSSRNNEVLDNRGYQ